MTLFLTFITFYIYHTQTRDSEVDCGFCLVSHYFTFQTYQDCIQKQLNVLCKTINFLYLLLFTYHLLNGMWVACIFYIRLVQGHVLLVFTFLP